MAQLLKPWQVLIFDADQVANDIMASKIREILPFCNIKQCTDNPCVRRCLENIDITLDCIIIDGNTTKAPTDVVEEAKQVFCERHPIMISLDNTVDSRYDIAWPKPFPLKEQMRRDLGKVLRDREVLEAEEQTMVFSPSH